MSIPLTKFMGGAKYRSVSAGFTLSAGDKRIQGIQNTSVSTIVVNLPMARQNGGIHFIVYNSPLSDGSVQVRYTDGFTITPLSTLAPGEVLHCWQVSTNLLKWRAQKHTLNTARPVAHGTRDAISNEPLPETFDPDCFDADDPCDGKALLTSGVAIPMFQNPCVAKNQYREPIRAGDFHMPRWLPVFLDGDFSVDGAHPNAMELSDEFYAALKNGGSPHFLEYAGPAHGESRHWHHIRYYGTSPGAWALNPDDETIGINVKRHIWKKQISYTVDETTYTLEIRIAVEFTMDGTQPVLVDTPALSFTGANIDQLAGSPMGYLREQFARWKVWGFAPNQIVDLQNFGTGYEGYARVHSISEDGFNMYLVGAWGESITLTTDTTSTPTIQTVTGGGVGESDRGAYGSLINLHVFTTEVDPAFVEGGTYTPVGASKPVAFTKDDPCCWGGVANDSSFWDEKWCHPQMVLCANIATTFQVPCGSNWVPRQDDNRSYCYQVPNGSLWTTDPQCCGAVGEFNGMWPNIVFGEAGTNANGWAAVTLGGDFPSSLPLAWFTFENGLGVGRTVLKPANPGWDEAKGILLDTLVNDASIKFCDPGQREFDKCAGHTDEPFEGVGGSHYCFKNKGGDQWCCNRIDRDAQIFVMQVCQKTTVTVDASCFPISTRCGFSTVTTILRLPVYDYTMMMASNQDNRHIQWKYFKQNQETPLFNYEYDESNVGDFTSERGTADFNPDDITLDTFTADPISNILLYDPSGSTHKDVVIQATFVVTEGSEASFALIARASLNFASELTAYVAVFDAVNLEAKLLQVINDTIVVLGTIETGALPFTSGECRVAATFEVDGSSLEFSYTLPGAEDSARIEKNDCEIENGGAPGIGSTDDEIATFEDFNITDNTRDYVEAVANLYMGEIDANVSPLMTKGYGTCDFKINPDCNVVFCSCTYTDQVLIEILDGAALEPIGSPSSPGAPSQPHWVYPPDCDGEPCAGAQDVCGRCPPPLKLFSLYLPTCSQSVASELTICKGFNSWYWTAVTCP